MKLAKLRESSAHPLLARIKIGAVAWIADDGAAEIMRVLQYRPELFGARFCDWTNGVLRGPSEWTIGERELFASVVSTANGCRYCAESHAAIAGRLLGDELVRAALADWKTAPLRTEVRAMLGFLQKLTKEPASVNEADVAALREAGVSDDGIETGVHVCAIFAVINRVADALGFEIPSASAISRTATILIKKGYGL